MKKVFENILNKKLNMKVKVFHQRKETVKILNKTMSQLLLMSYFHHKIVKKEHFYINQNITTIEKITRFC